jgi:AMP-activated protein kinase-like protein
MPKNIVKKTTRPLSPKPGVTQSRIAHPGEKRDTDEQPGRLTKAAPGAAGALKPPAPAVRVEFSPSPTTVPAKPLPALPASSAASQRSASEKLPITASTPKISPAAASTTPKTPVQSTPPTPPEKPAVLAQAPKPTPKTVTINFALRRPDAKQVSLCGDFNGWSRSTTPMKQHTDGLWKTTVALAPGRYQYKFFVDGEWIPDPLAHENVQNHYGTLNSVVEVHA